MANKLFVGNIEWSVTDEDLRDLFSQCGTVTEAVIIKDKFSGRSKGFGFVTFETDEEAQAAIEKFNEFDLKGRNIAVNVARPREER